MPSPEPQELDPYTAAVRRLIRENQDTRRMLMLAVQRLGGELHISVDEAMETRWEDLVIESHDDPRARTRVIRVRQKEGAHAKP